MELNRFEKVVFTEYWENLSRTAKVQKGAIGYISGDDRGRLTVVFDNDQDHLVTPNCVGQLAIVGVPRLIVNTVN